MVLKDQIRRPSNFSIPSLNCFRQHQTNAKVWVWHCPDSQGGHAVSVLEQLHYWDWCREGTLKMDDSCQCWRRVLNDFGGVAETHSQWVSLQSARGCVRCPHMSVTQMLKRIRDEGFKQQVPSESISIVSTS